MSCFIPHRRQGWTKWPEGGGTFTSCVCDVFGDGSCKLFFRFDGTTEDICGNCICDVSYPEYYEGVDCQGATQPFWSTSVPLDVFGYPFEFSATFWDSPDPMGYLFTDEFHISVKDNVNGVEHATYWFRVSYELPDSALLEAQGNNIKLYEGEYGWGFFGFIGTESELTIYYINPSTDEFYEVHGTNSPFGISVDLVPENLFYIEWNTRGTMDLFRLFNRAITKDEFLLLYTERCCGT